MHQTRQDKNPISAKRFEEIAPQERQNQHRNHAPKERATIPNQNPAEQRANKERKMGRSFERSTSRPDQFRGWKSIICLAARTYRFFNGSGTGSDLRASGTRKT
jgi:hypothetical protein